MTDPKFMTPPHRRAYLTHLNRCKVMDSYPEYTRQLDDVVIDDAAQKQRIQDTFWAMHNITYEVEEVDVTPEPTEDDPDPEQQTEYILHITVSSKTVDELAELYNFTQDQNDILHELLSDEI